MLLAYSGTASGGTVGQGVSGKIDFLMRVTGTSNAQLARALNFDASYISRIRAGKRGLPPELPFIEPAAAFFARNVREGYQAEALAREMGLPGSWPADKANAARLIAGWLEGAAGAGSQDVNVQSTGSTSALAAGRSSEARLFFGDGGRRAAALAFLADVVDANEPCELLLQSDERTAWMYEDPAFAAEWAESMAGLAAAGCTFPVVHTVSRGGNEMWEGLREWLPLYLTGAVRPYYYPRMRDGVRMRSLFVARGRCALVSNSVQGMEGDGLCVMHDDADAVRALEREFDAYLGLCRPLARFERPASEDELESTLAAFRYADGAVVAEAGGAIVCARPGHGALLASADAGIAYRIDEPRLVEAIASFAEMAARQRME